MTENVDDDLRRKIKDAISMSLYGQSCRDKENEFDSCDVHDPLHPDADADGIYEHVYRMDGFFDLNEVAIAVIMALKA